MKVQILLLLALLAPRQGEKPAVDERLASGMAALHDYSFDNALAEFRAVQESDRDNVMAVWGEAMTHFRPLWLSVNRQSMREVLAKARRDALRTSEAREKHEGATLPCRTRGTAGPSGRRTSQTRFRACGRGNRSSRSRGSRGASLLGALAFRPLASRPSRRRQPRADRRARRKRPRTGAGPPWRAPLFGARARQSGSGVARAPGRSPLRQGGFA